MGKKINPTLRSRIAPTPSGYLHIGNALNFAFTWLEIRSQGGELHLRIDDLDRPRVRIEYLEDIFQSLEWLGLDWDKGPFSVEGHEKFHSQQHKLNTYLTSVENILSKKIAFSCACSRKEILHLSQDGQYPGTCRKRNLDFQEGITSLRIFTPKKKHLYSEDQWQGPTKVDLDREMRDFVILRKDGLPAYQIASLVDDLASGINFIVRGIDLIPSTAAQLYLAEVLEENAFGDVQFAHHPLLKGPQGVKLSKSQGAPSLRRWRETQKPEDFFLLMGRLLKTGHSLTDIEEWLAYWEELGPHGIRGLIGNLVDG